jgi:hypothetical protein
MNGFETLMGLCHVRRRGDMALFGPALVVFFNGTSLKHVPDTVVHGLHGLKDKMPLGQHNRERIHLFNRAGDVREKRRHYQD